MRLLALFLIICSLTFVSAGGKSHFEMPAPLATKTLPTQFETLPEKNEGVRYLQDVVQTEYVDVNILKPKLVQQPIIQQRIVEQPIVRTRVINKPIVRRVMKRRVERPHILEKTEILPVLTEQKILQPKISEQNVIREQFSKEHSKSANAEKPTVAQKTHYQAPVAAKEAPAQALAAERSLISEGQQTLESGVQPVY